LRLPARSIADGISTVVSAPAPGGIGSGVTSNAARAIGWKGIAATLDFCAIGYVSFLKVATLKTLRGRDCVVSGASGMTGGF
jgi:hypothetical protein